MKPPCAKYTLPLLAASIAAPVSAANPDAYFWRALCSTGSISACAKIQVRKVWTSARTNYVEVRIRNLQGVDPRDNTGGSVFDFFTLALLHGDPALHLLNVPTPGLVGPVGTTGPGSFGSPGWGQDDGVIELNGFTFWLEDGRSGEPGDGIRGCSAGPQRGTATWLPMSTLSTCSAQGFTGWGAIANFRDGDPLVDWDVTGASVSLGGFTKDGAPFALDFTAASAIVAPEPASLVLLASGLVLVGAASWRRRRRR